LAGLLTNVYPRVPDVGTRMKTLLSTYRQACGADACILIHDAQRGRSLLYAMGRRAGHGARGLGKKGRGRGLPARVIPLECFHIASTGIDLLLGALSYGAAQVRVMATGHEGEGYLAALRQQMSYAQAIVSALGYEGEHFALVEADESAALEASLWATGAAQTVR